MHQEKLVTIIANHVVDLATAQEVEVEVDTNEEAEEAAAALKSLTAKVNGAGDEKED